MPSRVAHGSWPNGLRNGEKDSIIIIIYRCHQSTDNLHGFEVNHLVITPETSHLPPERLPQYVLSRDHSIPHFRLSCPPPNITAGLVMSWQRSVTWEWPSYFYHSTSGKSAQYPVDDEKDESGNFAYRMVAFRRHYQWHDSWEAGISWWTVGKGLYLSVSTIRHGEAISTTISVTIDLWDISYGKEKLLNTDV